MQNKNVQIPYELFFQLLQYFLMDNYDGEEIIRLGLEKKLDAMVNREVYSKSKTAPTNSRLHLTSFLLVCYLQVRDTLL